LNIEHLSAACAEALMNTLDVNDPFAIDAEKAAHKGAHAFARLLQLAEERDSGQIVRIARFIAATYNGAAFSFDPFDLRSVDVGIGDDMLCCLDALRWGRADLHRLVPDGDRRVREVIDRWGLRWPDSA
jgi:hypothetical protein